jgi:pyrroloquinoline quinone (PQQ) biosynthesis protein C
LINTLVGNALDREDFEHFGANVAGEDGAQSENHYQLYVDFVTGLGLDPDVIEEKNQPLPSTLGAMYTYNSLCRGPFEEGICAVGAAIEGAAEDWNIWVYEGLSQHYDLDEKTMRFWTIHAEEEPGHADTGWTFVDKYATTPMMQARIRKSFVHMSIAFRGMFDGCSVYLA